MRERSREKIIRYGAAVVSGFLLILAFPRFDFWPAAWVALVPLLVACHNQGRGEAGRLGCVAGFVFSLGSLTWITNSITVYGGLPRVVSFLILVPLALYLALYWAAFTALFLTVRERAPVVQLLYGAALWVTLEFVRAHLLTGFPWNLLGYTLYRFPPLIQVASLTGVYGVSFLVVGGNLALAQGIMAGREWRRALPSVGVAAGLLLLAWGYGLVFPVREIPETQSRVALLQGNIDQSRKWNPTLQEDTVRLYRRLSESAAAAGASLIVWPETAAPFFLREGGPLTAAVAETARATHTSLLVGSPDRERDASSREVRYYNSAFLVSPEGRIVGKYDKIHLVPFGEYVPLKSLLFFVEKMAEGVGDMQAGHRFTVFSSPAGRFGVTICYEAIFPDQVRRYVAGGAQFLVNITNDAWFGHSSGPGQHLAHAVMRAVENRRYLVRAANTGISAIVAPTGEIRGATGLFVEAVLTGQVERRDELTLYTRVGDLFAWLCLLGVGGVLLRESVSRGLWDRGRTSLL